MFTIVLQFGSLSKYKLNQIFKMDCSKIITKNISIW